MIPVSIQPVSALEISLARPGGDARLRRLFDFTGRQAFSHEPTRHPVMRWADTQGRFC